MAGDSYKIQIAKNSIILYIRMFLVLLVSLYTSRIILQKLGIEDFGLYNVVAGIVVLFGFINMSLSTASSRFINYELGKGCVATYSLETVFSTCIYVHIYVALLITLICETVGLYILYIQVQIPPLRLDAAVWTYHLSVASVCIGIIFTPFNALIIAYERMSVYAYISLFEVFGKLLIVIILPIISCDRLIVYSLFLLGITMLVQVAYVIYCYKNFRECCRLVGSDKALMKNMFTFTGWNLLGDSAYALFTQGVNLLLNLFFGPVVNAARGIAVQVNGVLLRFIQSFQTAVNPRIIQTYSNHDTCKMVSLMLMASRYTFCLLSIFAVPVFFSVDFLLSVWLVEVPPYTAIFIRIMILISYFDALGYSMTVAVNATGENRSYQLWVSGTMLLICPFSYLCLKLGLPPYSVFIIHFILGGIAHFFRLFWVHKKIDLPYKPYVKYVLIQGGGVVLFSSLLIFLVKWLIPCNPWIFLLLSFLIVCSFVLLIGLDKREKMYLLNKLRR